MTKTLTEQWREGTLPEGYYYTKLNDDDGTIDINYCWDDGCFQDYCDNMVEKVLSAVPSYDEYKELVRKSDKLYKIMSDAVTNQGDCQQIVEDNLNRELSRKTLHLEIATKALKEINKNYRFTVAQDVVYKALKEMEGVK